MNKTAIITGTSRGIGWALAKKLLDNHYKVIGAARTEATEAINHPNFEVLSLDLSDSESIAQFVSEVKAKNIAIDLLINNAAIGPDLGVPYPELESFEQTIAINVTGTVFLTEALVGLIKEGGKILNVSSKMGSVNHCQGTSSVAYRISKSALNMYSKVLSNRLAPKIAVASIHPGWVQTTISSGNVNAPLTPATSADKIYHYLCHQFKNGDYWDVESNVHLEW